MNRVYYACAVQRPLPWPRRLVITIRDSRAWRAVVSFWGWC